MTQRLTIGDSGELTIPSDVRQAAGFERDAELLIEVRNGQIVLFDAAHPPVEMYTEERIAEFEAETMAAEPDLQRYLTKKSADTL